MTLTSPKPVLVIVDGAIDLTGALVAAIHEAKLLAATTSTVLVLPRGHRVAASRLDTFTEVIELPMRPLRKTLSSLFSYLPALLFSSRKLLAHLRRLGADRLQINDFHFAEGAVVRLLGFRGRIVTWIRIDPKRYGLIGRLWLALARWSSDDLVVVSNFIASRLPSGYRSTPIYDAATPADRGRRAPGKRLLFVGNYIEGKGQDDAIRAFHRIALQFPEAELLFHGSDMGLDKNRAYRQSLEQLAASRKGGERIHLRDFLSDPATAYREAYAALNFSHSESFSLTCLEASANGLAVIATRCGGPQEIIDDGHNGYLVPVGDVASMADRMADLLSDGTRTEAMGEAGRHLVATRFNAEEFRGKATAILDLT